MPEMSAYVHPTADVAPDVRIGSGSRVWDQARIREGATIGTDCIIGRGAYIDTGVLVGDRVKIQNNALVYHGVTVGSGVFIGPAAVLTNDRYPRSINAAGELATADDWTVSEIHLGNGSSIGAAAVVVAGCDVGSFATVGAGAVVTRDVPDHALVAGNPARPLGWVCRCGRRLLDGNGVPVAPDHLGSATCPDDKLGYDITHGTCHLREER